MSWLSSWIHPSNPADAAMPYLNQIPGVGHGAYDPYIQRGLKAGGQFGDLASMMAADPNAFYNKIAGGYTESPGYQFQLQQGLSAANNANAAGGTLGTPKNVQQNMGFAQGLASQDFNNYLQHVLGINQQGMSGLNTVNQMGFQGSSNLADMLASNLSAQGQYAYRGQEQKNAQHSAMLNNLAQLFAAIGMAPMSGGGSLFGMGAQKLFGGGGQPWKDPGSLPGWEGY